MARPQSANVGDLLWGINADAIAEAVSAAVRQSLSQSVVWISIQQMVR